MPILYTHTSLTLNSQQLKPDQHSMAHKRSKPTESTSAMERQQSGSNVEYSFDEEAIVNIQKRLAFALRICTQEKTVKEFETVKFKGVNYAVGDFLEIHSTKKEAPYVARLKRIVRVPTFMEEFPFIEIEWCLGKQHLPEALLASFGPHISNAEIFPSPGSNFCLYIDSIKCKCFVLSFEEYSQLETSYDYYYFSRAIFDQESQRLEPPPENWKKACLCLMPSNPDRQYIQCGECQNWFHDTCVGEVDMDCTFVCRECQL